uniref:Uncharacterized protein n=1 Tax=Parascaris equorum TaxID=6256 RepID=A0A914RLW8_PAREQ
MGGQVRPMRVVMSVKVKCGSGDISSSGDFKVLESGVISSRDTIAGCFDPFSPVWAGVVFGSDPRCNGMRGQV